MNVLQIAVKESFKTSIVRHDKWEDPDGIIHEEHVVEMKPYCSTMDELAILMGLSRSQAYRLMKSPTRSFNQQEMTELHKQLWWKKRNLENEISVPLSETKELIMSALQQTQQMSENYIEHLEATRDDPANPDNRSNRPPVAAFQRLMKAKVDAMKEKLDEQQKRIIDQDELIKRLLDMSERQQDLLEKFTDQVQKFTNRDDESDAA